jgi:hypothetical protein
MIYYSHHVHVTDGHLTAAMFDKQMYTFVQTDVTLRKILSRLPQLRLVVLLSDDLVSISKLEARVSTQRQSF